MLKYILHVDLRSCCHGDAVAIRVELLIVPFLNR